MNTSMFTLFPPVLLSPVAAFAAEPSNQAAFVAMPDLGLGVVIGVMLLMVAYGVHNTIKGLDNDPEWTLSRALSDNTIVDQSAPVDIETWTEKHPGVPVPVIKAPMPSSSRLIAFLGLIVIMGTFLGVGCVLIWSLGKTGAVPDLEKAQVFLYGGATMFAPYLFSQAQAALSSFAKK